MARFVLLLFVVVAIYSTYATAERGLIRDCGPNEVWTNCGTACERTCANRNSGPQACIAMCKIGCVCQGGHVRRTEGGECIREDECPRISNYDD